MITASNTLVIILVIVVVINFFWCHCNLPQAENLFKVPLWIDSFCDFNVPFQVTLARTKPFMETGKNFSFMGRATIKEKPACWGRLQHPLPPPSCNYDQFTIAFPLIKLNLLPQNKHYQKCLDKSLHVDCHFEICGSTLLYQVIVTFLAFLFD